LETAIDNSLRVNVKYVYSKGEKDFIVEPLKIALFDGFWYCITQGKQDKRLLKLRVDRIKSVDVLEETFTPDVDINKMLEQSVNIWFDGVRGERVLIKVSPNIAKYFKDKVYFPLQKLVSENKDGSIVLETYPAHSEEIMHTIMHWIPNLTVVEPESLKNEVKKIVTTYLNSL
jgi:predicted DNA-binding transcriptional regulator YafY